MRSYQSAATIEADPQRVWAVLTDAPAYTEWDSGVERVEGRMAAGERIKVVSAANPGRAFPVTGSEAEPPRTTPGSGGMPLGLFKGVRAFSLTPDASGT